MIVTAMPNGNWLSAPKHRAKMVDATEKVQTVILDGAKIFLGHRGNLRPAMENRGKMLGINPPLGGSLGPIGMPRSSACSNMAADLQKR